ncbi:MAG: GNAT family N-acetyltransferase [Candidatus Limnocylindrales bacterium]|jgi:RimJ/RimL family protein N-acetyltransferase
MSGHPWPLFDLRVRTPRLELRLPTDDDLLELVRVARAGIVDAERAAFLVPWHKLPSPAFERQFLLHWWATRGSWNPSKWALGLAILQEGRAVGIQELIGTDFAIRRTILSGSWLGREFQGQGLGTEARAAILALAFDGLGAEMAESGYLEGNVASARVSEKLGYREIGDTFVAIEGKRVREVKLRVTRDTWRRDLVPVTIEGLEPSLPLFGIGHLGPDDWATP